MCILPPSIPGRFRPDPVRHEIQVSCEPAFFHGLLENSIIDPDHGLCCMVYAVWFMLYGLSGVALSCMLQGSFPKQLFANQFQYFQAMIENEKVSAGEDSCIDLIDAFFLPAPDVVIHPDLLVAVDDGYGDIQRCGLFVPVGFDGLKISPDYRLEEFHEGCIFQDLVRASSQCPQFGQEFILWEEMSFSNPARRARRNASRKDQLLRERQI